MGNHLRSSGFSIGASDADDRSVLEMAEGKLNLADNGNSLLFKTLNERVGGGNTGREDGKLKSVKS